jgi:hypothetical protein
MHTGDRSADAIDAGQILPGYEGVIVRDGYAGYGHLTSALHDSSGSSTRFIVIPGSPGCFPGRRFPRSRSERDAVTSLSPGTRPTGWSCCSEQKKPGHLCHGVRSSRCRTTSVGEAGF